jgi:hypothetical protein
MSEREREREREKEEEEVVGVDSRPASQPYTGDTHM